MRDLWRAQGARLCLGAILLLALALRLYRLDAQSLWNDEGTSVALAGRDLATITRSAAADIHPPLYYYLLHAWTGLWGTGEAAARSLSALAGVGVVAATYALGRRTLGAGAGLAAALLAAVSPFGVYYAQEARMYVLATLLGALSMLAYVRLLAGWAAPSTGRRATLLAPGAYLLATVAAVYTHYFAYSLLAAQNVALVLWLAWRYRAGARRGLGRAAAHWAGLQAAVVALYVPWLIVSRGSLAAWPAVSEPLTLPFLAREALRVMALGVTAEGGRAALLAAAPALAALAGAVHGLRRGERAVAGGVGLALLYAAVPVLVIYVLSLSRPMYKSKFLLLATPGYHLLLGAGVVVLARGVAAALRREAAAPLAAGILAVGALLPVLPALDAQYTDPRTYRDDYRGIVRYIEATAGPRDTILINAPGQIETVDYYYDGPLPMVPLPLQRPIDVEATRAALEDLLGRHRRVYAILWATDESDPARTIEGYLDAHAFKTLDSWFGNVRLAVYAVPGAPPGDIQVPTDYRFGDAVRLRGYSLGAPEVPSGDIVQLTLYWECLRPIPDRFKVFTHLVDPRGQIAGQRDAEPAGGSRPTDGWGPGETVVDNYGLLVRPGTAPGEHTLRIGLYDGATGARLGVSSAEGALGDALDLAAIRVTPPASPPPAGALGIETPSRARAGGLALLGHNLHRLGFDHEPLGAPQPGEGLGLVLFWERQEGETAGDALALSLRDGRGRVAWQGEMRILGGAYPPESWGPGEVVRDAQVLVLPGNLPPGAYGLYLTLPGVDGPGVRLQRVEISG